VNLFYQPDIEQGIRHLDEEESKHAVRVLRMKAGDEMTITDGKGSRYQARLSKPDHRKCAFEIISQQKLAARSFCIEVAVAPTKNSDRTEWFVEKAVETGIEKIHFFVSKNSERKTVNIERVKKIMISAMKQSGQVWLPSVTAVRPFQEMLELKVDQKFICHADSENREHLKSVAGKNSTYLALIGPEGDFTPEELREALDKGFRMVSLGPNRLRTETAALTACQVLNFINS
jgi:16S rRNA (uracil1498-N3)-methyltransferase